MNKNNTSDNVNSLLSIFKLVLFIVIFCMVFSLIASIIDFIKNHDKVNGKEIFDDAYKELVTDGTIPQLPDPLIPEILEIMQDPATPVINDIYSDLAVFEYNDIVVFVKNLNGSKADEYSHNVVFRKTEKGLVLDGMFILYSTFGYTQSNYCLFSGKADASYYSNYNNYNFQQKMQFRARGYTHSCFSFNDNVSRSIMLNSNFALSWFRPVKLLCTAFANYKEIYNTVNKYCMKEIFTQFTSFGDKQHIMFSSADGFSDFWTDVYNSIKTLNKNCLVDYTNCNVGLYDGDPNTENCQYYKASSFFKVQYQRIGRKAYSVDTKNYAEGHAFDCKNKSTAIPEITLEFSNNQDNSTMTLSEFKKYLFKNKIDLKANLKITKSNSAEIVNQTISDLKHSNYLVNRDFNIDSYVDYFDFDTYSAEIEIELTQNNETIENNLISFEKGTFVIDKETSRIKVRYTIIAQKEDPGSNPDSTLDKATFNWLSTNQVWVEPIISTEPITVSDDIVVGTESMVTSSITFSEKTYANNQSFAKSKFSLQTDYSCFSNFKLTIADFIYNVDFNSIIFNPYNKNFEIGLMLGFKNSVDCDIVYYSFNFYYVFTDSGYSGHLVMGRIILDYSESSYLDSFNAGRITWVDRSIIESIGQQFNAGNEPHPLIDFLFDVSYSAST